MEGVQLEAEFQSHGKHNRHTRAASDFFQPSDMLISKELKHGETVFEIFYDTFYPISPPYVGSNIVNPLC